MSIGPRRIPRASALFAALTLFGLAVAGRAWGRQGEESRPAPRFEGLTIPDPPQQRLPWTIPKTSLPRFLVRASATLFEQGLADPRGGDYREIEIAVGGVWSNVGGILTTHGWVLPETPGEKARFAVTWSGMTYPAVTVGPPADLEADVKVLEDAARALQKSPRSGATGAFGGFGTNEGGLPGLLDGPAPDQAGPAAPDRPGRDGRTSLGRGDGPPTRASRPDQGRPHRLRHLVSDDGERPGLVSFRPRRLRPHARRRRRRPGRCANPDVAPGGRRGEGRGDGLRPSRSARQPRRGARPLHRFPRPAPRVPGRPRAPGPGDETPADAARGARQGDPDRRP